MLSNYIIPVIVSFILIYGFIKKRNIYEDFIDGAVDGLKIIKDIIPAMLAMILAVSVFTGSGFLSIFKTNYSDIISMIILRPISGNASFAILNDIYRTYGVDSFFSFLASIIQGSTDTTIYVLALYFSSIKIKDSRYALYVGLFADFCGILAAFIISNFLF